MNHEFHHRLCYWPWHRGSHHLNRQSRLGALMSISEQLAAIHDKLDALIEHAIAMKPPPGVLSPKIIVDISTMKVLFWHIKRGFKIDAIKDMRQLTGCGLKEAKDLVEVLYEPLHTFETGDRE